MNKKLTNARSAADKVAQKLCEYGPEIDQELIFRENTFRFAQLEAEF